MAKNGKFKTLLWLYVLINQSHLKEFPSPKRVILHSATGSSKRINRSRHAKMDDFQKKSARKNHAVFIWWRFVYSLFGWFSQSSHYLHRHYVVNGNKMASKKKRKKAQLGRTMND
uniref:Cnidarian restricted protein n=1 Tax=Clytia hemisphaerica TaxID=252671 RepID=A0A7M5VDQ5_9CNID